MTKETDLPTSEEVISRAVSFAPKLAERATESESLRSIPEATIADFIDSGLHRIMQPRRYGGWGMGWDTHVSTAIELGKGDGSQAWVLTGYSEQAQLIGSFSKDAQDEVWADDSATFVAPSLACAPSGKLVAKNGDYVASGKWSFSSGIDHAKWLLVSASIEAGESRRQIWFLVPKSDVKVIDDWQVTGLTGTGSKSFTMDGVLVPAHRALDETALGAGTAPGLLVNPEPIYRLQRQSASLALASVPLGIASAMIGDLAVLAGDTAKRGVRAFNNFATALRIAESQVEVEGACLSAVAAARETMEILTRGKVPTAERIALNSLKAGYAAMIAARAADRVFAAAGAKANYLSNRLTRSLYDVHAVGAQDALTWDKAAADFGRLRLGEKI